MPDLPLVIQEAKRFERVAGGFRQPDLVFVHSNEAGLESDEDAFLGLLQRHSSSGKTFSLGLSGVWESNSRTRSLSGPDSSKKRSTDSSAVGWRLATVWSFTRSSTARWV